MCLDLIALIQKASKDYSELAPYVFPDLDTNRGKQSVCAEFIDKMENLSKRLGLPQKLREVNIPKNACEKWPPMQ